MKEANNIEVRPEQAAAVETERLPAVDVHETREAYVLYCDLPGVDEKNVEVALADNVLTIEGRPAAERMEGYARLYRDGGEAGIYRRSFAVAEDVDPEKIDAAITRGVLKVTVGKRASGQPRKIKVQGG